MTGLPANERIPVVLVHGWNSHPGIWNRLDPFLKEAGIPCWKFDHSSLKKAAVPEIAESLRKYIGTMRYQTGCSGPINLVCHSMGSSIARYYLEVLDGKERRERVRQIICLGPPNTGSALAELFNDPEHRDAIIGQLTGVFVPGGYDPAADPLVQDVRPGSTVMQQLRGAGTRSDCTYRIIVTTNTGRDSSFFPWFSGKTWVWDGSTYGTTFEGDGIVAHSESCLPGISPEVIAPDREHAGTALPLTHYCHINLPRNPAVMEKIMEYLMMPVPDTGK